MTQFATAPQGNPAPQGGIAPNGVAPNNGTGVPVHLQGGYGYQGNPVPTQYAAYQTPPAVDPTTGLPQQGSPIAPAANPAQDALAAARAAAGGVPAGIVPQQQPAAAPAGADVPPVPVKDPVTGQWVLPNQAAPTAPTNPYAAAYHKAAEITAQGNNYIETSIKGLAQEFGVTEDAFTDCYEKALEHNDLSLIDIRSLGNLTPEQAQRAYNLAYAAAQQTQAEIKTMQEKIYNVAGGVDQWNHAIAAFNSKADENTQRYVAYLANTGNETEAAKLVVEFVRGTGAVSYTQQPAIQGGTGTVQTGLSRAEYAAEINKIELSRGNRSYNDPQIKAQMDDLDRRRALGRSQGL